MVADEMSESRLMQRGYWSMTQHSASLSGGNTLDELFEGSLDLVHDFGFAGGMISLVLHNKHKDRVIPQAAKGPRFGKIKELGENLAASNLLLRIADDKTERAHFVADSRTSPECDQAIIEKSGLISQCIIRLTDQKNETLGLFQVDMGDLSRREEWLEEKEASLLDEERKMFESFGLFVGANLDRIFSWRQNQIARRLDEALVRSLNEDTVFAGLHTFIKEVQLAFRVSGAHVRLLNEDKTHLVVVRGVGDFYDCAREIRAADDLSEVSPSVAALNDPDKRASITNQAWDNPEYQELLQKYRNNARMTEALLNVRSYASIPFGGSGKSIGTISLLKDERWFFKRHHERALDALQKHAGILVENLSRKQNDRILQTAGINTLSMAAASRC